MYSSGFVLTLRRVCLLVLVAGLSACPRGAAPPEARPNIVVVLIDTLRRDHLSTYGYDRTTTPFIDSLSANGLVFDDAVSQAPWTGASMASLWTSRYPSEVGGTIRPDEDGVRFLGRTASENLTRTVPTLAELLRSEGYRTIAVLANGYAGASLGLLRGFDSRWQKRVSADKLTDAAIEKLDAEGDTPGDRPFFLYLHYIDTHEPLQPPEPYASLFATGKAEPHDWTLRGWRFDKRSDDRTTPEFTRFRDHKLALYDGAIRFVDAQVQRLAEHIEKRGDGDDTVFVIASDHGEEFWDHAEFQKDVHLDPRGIAGVGHGHSLFAELTGVPLVLHGPGVPKGRVRELVRNIDLAPSLLGLAGLEGPPPSMRGIDLVEAVRAGSIPTLSAYTENIAYGPEAQSLQAAGFKLIRYTDARTPRKEFLFDLTADPAERQDVADEHPDTAKQLRTKLEETVATLAPGPRPTSVIDEETAEQLRALGYME